MCLNEQRTDGILTENLIRSHTEMFEFALPTFVHEHVQFNNGAVAD